MGMDMYADAHKSAVSNAIFVIDADVIFVFMVFPPWYRIWVYYIGEITNCQPVFEKIGLQLIAC